MTLTMQFCLFRLELKHTLAPICKTEPRNYSKVEQLDVSSLV